MRTSESTIKRNVTEGKMPNFLIVGSAKSGTTSLYHYLKQHPQVYMSPNKEPLFFCSYGENESDLTTELYPCPLENVVNDIESYKTLFADAYGEKAVGEASVYYLLDHDKTIKNIKKLVPEWTKLKIIIILRNPIEACFSNYLMYSLFLQYFLKNKNVPTFEESFDLETTRLASGNRALAHFHWFLYHDQVKHYMDTFDDVKVYLHTDLKVSSNELLKSLFDFLEVDNTFVPDNAEQEYNISGIPKVGFIYKLFVVPGELKEILRLPLKILFPKKVRDAVRNVILKKNLKKPVMDENTKKKVKAYYHEDILKLQKLINRDLSDWL